MPTMGALHPGHLSLLRNAKSRCDIVVCSIFVNPTQFNDASDLEKYPRPIEQDTALLESISCDVLFLPDVEEMYGENEHWHIDLGSLETMWEGAFRPGHFQGVTQVVYKLFQIVQPHYAFFGQKDFQQCMVVRRLVDIMQVPVRLVICPIERSREGLALSSRNVRLSDHGLRDALDLSKALRLVRHGAKEQGLSKSKLAANALLDENPNIQVEYFAICKPDTLLEVKECEGEQLVALIAAYIEGVRLIDNMLIDCQ